MYIQLFYIDNGAERMSSGISEKIMTWQPDEGPGFQIRKLTPDMFGDGFVVRSSNWLGDAVMSFPALKQLRTILPPHCGLFVLSPAGLAPIYRAMKDVVDQVIPLKDAHSFPSKEEYAQMQHLNAHAGMLFNNSFRDALAMRFGCIKYLYGAKARHRSILLKRAFPFEKRRDHELNYPHQSAKYLSMVYALGAEKWDGVMPQLYPFTAPEKREDNLYTLLESPHILAIAPGAAYGDGKRWNAGNFKKVAEAWLEKYSDGVVLALGSKAERSGAGEAVAELDHARAVNLAGTTSLDELMVILKRAHQCVANDSGIMHLSAALGSSGVAVFGSTDPAATAPLSQKWTMLYDKLPCSPCFKRDCPLGTKACLDLITPDDVKHVLGLI